MMQAHFDRRSEQERAVDVRGADGVERTQSRRGTRTVMTEFGKVELERNLYQAPRHSRAGTARCGDGAAGGEVLLRRMPRGSEIEGSLHGRWQELTRGS